jgi:hypothetical protein
MTQQHSVGLQLLDSGHRCRKALHELIGALPNGKVDEPDETGTFEAEVEAPSQEEALHLVWNAIAESGCDDHVVFTEHPDIPEHWRLRTDGAAA